MKKYLIYTWVTLFSVTQSVAALSASYTHRQYFTNNVTANQACDMAEGEVRRKALAAQLGEMIQSSSFQTCIALGDKQSDCKTHTDLYVQTPNGYIKSFNLIDREIAVTELGQVCVVSAEVEVESFKGFPDPQFSLSVDLQPGTLIRDQAEAL